MSVAWAPNKLIASSKMSFCSLAGMHGHLVIANRRRMPFFRISSNMYFTTSIEPSELAVRQKIAALGKIFLL